MFRLYFTFLCIFCFQWANGQANREEFRRGFEEAMKLTEENLHPQALDAWLELLDKEPDNAVVNYNTGRSYLNSFSQQNKSISYLQKASSAGISKNFDPYNPFETKPPVEVYFYQGRASLLNYKPDSAEAQLNRFIEMASPKHFLIPEAQLNLLWVKNAKQAMTQPVELEAQNLDSVINTEYPEFSPVISLDENSIFFTSRRLRTDSSNFGTFEESTGQYFEDVYVSYKNRNGEWQTPELLNINQPGHTATVNVSADGQILYIYRDDNGDGNIYESRLVGETWSEPEKMGDWVNSSAWETHVAVTPDNSTIYFVSDRKGGLGGRDIYRTTVLPNGQWSKALNLGPTINTQYDEDAVFISPDGSTLYFSSQGHNSMGGFDIFTSTLDENNEWTTPKNLGYPLNTPDDDVFFVTSADGKRGYFSSASREGFGEKDLYVVPLPGRETERGLAVLKGFIVPAEGEKLPESATVYITNNQTGETREYKPRARDGVFVAILPPCIDYNIDYRVEGQSVGSEYLKVPCEAVYTEYNKEVLLNPLSLAASEIKDLGANGSEKITQTKDVQGDTTTVTTTQGDKSYVEKVPTGVTQFEKKYGYNQTSVDLEETRFILFVNELSEMLKAGKTVVIEIEGSASKVPTRTYGNNQKLADLRAEEGRVRLVSAIEERGFDKNKITIKSVKGVVQGPSYRYDFKDEDRYRPFQYLKITVK